MSKEITFVTRQEARNFVYNFKCIEGNQENYHTEIVDRGDFYTWFEYGQKERTTTNVEVANAFGAVKQDRWAVIITPIIKVVTEKKFVLSVPTRQEARDYINFKNNSKVYTGTYKLVDLGYCAGDSYRWCVVQEVEVQINIFDNLADKVKSFFKGSK